MNTHNRRIQSIISHFTNYTYSPQVVTSTLTSKSVNQLYDVVIIGGGIIGSSTAYRCAKSGLKVLLLDQFEAGHENGSSHGDGRIIRYSYSEKVFVDLAKVAYPLWDETERDSATQLRKVTGGIDFGDPQLEVFKELIETYQREKVPYEVLSAEEGNVRFPQFKFQPGQIVVYQKDAGVLYASTCVKTLWNLSKRFGATTLSNKRVQRIKVESENLVTVVTEDQTIFKAKSVVLACGGWINDFLLRSQLNLTIPVTISQEKVFYWNPKEPVNTSIDFTQKSCPIAIHYAKDKDDFYSLPQIDIQGVKIGYHLSGPKLENMTQPKKEYPEKDYKKVQNYVSKYMPMLNHEKEGHSVICHYTTTEDRYFIIDRHPRFSNIIISSTCSGHGFKFGVAIGEVLCKMVKNEPTPISIEEFSLARFKKPLQKRLTA
eukprot:gene5953-7414_t